MNAVECDYGRHFIFRIDLHKPAGANLPTFDADAVAALLGLLRGLNRLAEWGSTVKQDSLHVSSISYDPLQEFCRALYVCVPKTHKIQSWVELMRMSSRGQRHAVLAVLLNTVPFIPREASCSVQEPLGTTNKFALASQLVKCFGALKLIPSEQRKRKRHILEASELNEVFAINWAVKTAQHSGYPPHKHLFTQYKALLEQSNGPKAHAHIAASVDLMLTGAKVSNGLQETDAGKQTPSQAPAVRTVAVRPPMRPHDTCVVPQSVVTRHAGVDSAKRIPVAPSEALLKRDVRDSERLTDSGCSSDSATSSDASSPRLAPDIGSNQVPPGDLRRPNVSRELERDIDRLRKCNFPPRSTTKDSSDGSGSDYSWVWSSQNAYKMGLIWDPVVCPDGKLLVKPQHLPEIFDVGCDGWKSICLPLQDAAIAVDQRRTLGRPVVSIRKHNMETRKPTIHIEDCTTLDEERILALMCLAESVLFTNLTSTDSTENVDNEICEWLGKVSGFVGFRSTDEVFHHVREMCSVLSVLKTSSISSRWSRGVVDVLKTFYAISVKSVDEHVLKSLDVCGSCCTACGQKDLAKPLLVHGFGGHRSNGTTADDWDIEQNTINSGLSCKIVATFRRAWYIHSSEIDHGHVPAAGDGMDDREYAGALVVGSSCNGWVVGMIEAQTFVLRLFECIMDRLTALWDEIPEKGAGLEMDDLLIDPGETFTKDLFQNALDRLSGLRTLIHSPNKCFLPTSGMHTASIAVFGYEGPPATRPEIKRAIEKARREISTDTRSRRAAYMDESDQGEGEDGFGREDEWIDHDYEDAESDAAASRKHPASSARSNRRKKRCVVDTDDEGDEANKVCEERTTSGQEPGESSNTGRRTPDDERGNIEQAPASLPWGQTTRSHSIHAAFVRSTHQTQSSQAAPPVSSCMQAVEEHSDRFLSADTIRTLRNPSAKVLPSRRVALFNISTVLSDVASSGNLVLCKEVALFFGSLSSIVEQSESRRGSVDLPFNSSDERRTLAAIYGLFKTYASEGRFDLAEHVAAALLTHRELRPDLTPGHTLG